MLCLQCQWPHHWARWGELWWGRPYYNPGHHIYIIWCCNHHSEQLGLVDLFRSVERGCRATPDPPYSYCSPWMAKRWVKPPSWFPVSADGNPMRGIPPCPPPNTFVSPTNEGNRYPLGRPAIAWSYLIFLTLRVCGELRPSVSWWHMRLSSFPRRIETGLVSPSLPAWMEGSWYHVMVHMWWLLIKGPGGRISPIPLLYLDHF